MGDRRDLRFLFCFPYHSSLRRGLLQIEQTCALRTLLHVQVPGADRQEHQREVILCIQRALRLSSASLLESLEVIRNNRLLEF